MLANILILLFILTMAYWWGNQGVFGAFLHLGAVILAGTLAFAIWEPFTIGLVIKMFPAHAWGIGLLLPFILFLFLIRGSLDYFIKTNVYFIPLVNLIGGGLIAAFAAMLTAGITIIGLGFLSIGISIGGYEPYQVNAQGHFENVPGKHLWFNVDHMAGAFFEKLSVGLFSNGTPLGQYQPNIAMQAGVFRINYDPNGSLVAKPDSIDVVGIYAAKTPVQGLDASLFKALGNQVRKANHKVIIIDTHWDRTRGKSTYDADGTVRIPPFHVQLLTKSITKESREFNLYQSIGASKLIPGSNPPQRLYTPMQDDRTYMTASDPDDYISFVFVIPATEKPENVIIRRLRFQLPNRPDKDFAKFTAAIGILEASFTAKLVASQTTVVGKNGSNVGTRQGSRTGSIASEIRLSNEFPKIFSHNNAPGTLQLQGQMVVEGFAEIRPIKGLMISPKNAVSKIYVPSHNAVVRVQIDRQAAQSLLGKILVTAAMLQGITLTDNRGVVWQPMGYSWLQANGTQVIKIDRNDPIRSAKQTPIAKMKSKDELYLYFAVSRGIKIVSYNVGKTKQDVSIDIPAKGKKAKK